MATNTAGFEVVREVKNDESEEAILIRTQDPIEVKLGETVDGADITTTAQHFLAVDVHVDMRGIAGDLGVDVDDLSDEELEEMFDGMGMPSAINEGVIALSNADGEVGHAVLREEDTDMNGILDVFAERFL